jgi:hypothetical protein
VSRECLDHVLIYGRRHLERVLKVYVDHYRRRDHIGGWAWPYPPVTERRRSGGLPERPVERREVLGGLIHEYRWAARSGLLNPSPGGIDH